MHDINRIKDLLAGGKNLTSRYEELDAAVDQYQLLRKNQEFIPEELSSSISTMLTDIKTDQNSFISEYKALDFGPTPSSVADCKAELEDYEKYIIEKSSYVDVINFVLSLDSDSEDAQSALEQHKAFAASYDCRSNSVEQCESDLKKYILLQKTFREEDPAKRLSNLIELSPMIDFPLVVALNTNALTSSLDSEEPSEEQSAADEMSAPQKTISGRPAPDEAPVSHSGIESGLTTELNHVLSRENIAASLTAAADQETFFQREPSAPQNTGISNPWKNIGITDPVSICYSVSDENMQIYRCDRPKKFSVSDFQGEMSLRSTNRFQKQWALKDAYRYGATSPQMLAELIQEDPDLVEDACDTLVDNGYLKAFELTGSAFVKMDKIYILTASGRKIFTHSETAAELNLAAVDKAATPPFASHANAVLNRGLFLKSKKLMELCKPSRKFNVGSFILETNSFINFFPTTDNTGTYSYVSVLGTDVKDYLIFKIELEEMLPTLTSITVVGMTCEHAKALADWIADSFPSELAGKKLQTYAYENDTYYSYPDGKPFRIS